MAFLDPGQWLSVAIVATIVLISFYLWMHNIPRFIGTMDLSGKTVIVTGANGGIGYTTALDLARRNARVILACRNMRRGEAARDAIIQLTANEEVVVRELDVSRLKSVRQFVDRVYEEEQRLDILINNAGVSGLPKEMTEDGLEVNFATNHFGPFLLTNLLLDLLKTSAPSRIINLSSTVQRFGNINFDNLRAEKSFSFYQVYFDSKLANVLFTRELARQLEGTDVTVCAVHPGSVRTNLLNSMPFYVRIPMAMFRLFLRSAEEGAQTTLYCAMAEEVQDMSGKYFAECQLAETQVNPLANDEAVCRKLWEVSCRYTGLDDNEDHSNTLARRSTSSASYLSVPTEED